ncbi:MAG: 30S ribosomal protein S13 [Candidatus Sulfobium sp.]
MARIAGVDLPKNERIEIGLTRIFGIGRSLSNKILEEVNVSPAVRVKDLSDEDAVKIRSVIERDYRVEGDLRRDISMNIKRLIDIGSYRGLRHRASLPARGQRTKTNARTRKGPRKAVVGKKKEA